MTTRENLQSSAVSWRAARTRSQQSATLLSVIGLILLAAASIPAAMVGSALAGGDARYPLTGLAMLAIFTPVVIVLAQVGGNLQERTNVLMDDLEHQLTEALRQAELEMLDREAQVRRQEFETRLAKALEMADRESEAVMVVDRALSLIVAGAPVQLMLADNSHAHLNLVSGRDRPALCGVESPDKCPAARRAQVQHFTDSEALDACPRLQARVSGRCSATCVPVSLMGRTVGIIHATGDPGAMLSEETTQALTTLANLAGARLGLLRMMAETQLQARTDSLTGLLNRRSLENKVAMLRTEGVAYAVAMADLDHFKQVNDTFGHETGDRALRAFAQTMRSMLRTQDLVCRYGGEEFAVVLPGCGAADALALLEGIQERWLVTAGGSGLPDITVSFGVVDAIAEEDLNASLARADAALFQAKHDGRNRIVVARHPTERTDPQDDPADLTRQLGIAG